MTALSVLHPQRFGRLLASDALNISRDPILLGAAIMSILPALALAIWGSAIDAAVSSAFGLEHFTRILLPVALMLPATLLGWVSGFLILEDRDEGLLPAYDIMPVGKLGMLAYRAVITSVLSAAIGLLALFIVNGPPSPLVVVTVLPVVAANAVLCTLILPTWARNRVEGLALSKITSILAVIPVLAAIPSPWRLLGGVFPSYWIGEAIIPAAENAMPPILVLALALGTQALWLAALAMRFSRRGL